MKLFIQGDGKNEWLDALPWQEKLYSEACNQVGGQGGSFYIAEKTKSVKIKSYTYHIYVEAHWSKAFLVNENTQKKRQIKWIDLPNHNGAKIY